MLIANMKFSLGKKNNFSLTQVWPGLTCFDVAIMKKVGAEIINLRYGGGNILTDKKHTWVVLDIYLSVYLSFLIWPEKRLGTVFPIFCNYTDRQKTCLGCPRYFSIYMYLFPHLPFWKQNSYCFKKAKRAELMLSRWTVHCWFFSSLTGVRGHKTNKGRESMRLYRGERRATYRLGKSENFLSGDSVKNFQKCSKFVKICQNL